MGGSSQVKRAPPSYSPAMMMPARRFVRRER